MAGGALEPPTLPAAGSGDEAVLGSLIATAMVQTLGGRLAEFDARPGDMPVESFTELVRADYERWGPMVRASGASAGISSPSITTRPAVGS